jgi:hypothetical protein
MQIKSPTLLNNVPKFYDHLDSSIDHHGANPRDKTVTKQTKIAKKIIKSNQTVKEQNSSFEPLTTQNKRLKGRRVVLSHANSL